MKTFFYVIIVSYNAGTELVSTYKSICRQQYKNMLVLIQDGASTDGSLDALRDQIAAGGIKAEIAADLHKRTEEILIPRTAIVSKKDKGIYDAMNKAIARAQLDRDRRFGNRKHARYSERETKPFTKRVTPDCFTIFMNCGDRFYHYDVLELADERICAIKKRIALQANISATDRVPGICYGDTYDRQTAQVVAAPRVLDDFACYRALPCHQSCFYNLKFLENEKFDLSFRIRADYEQFLRLKYKCHVQTFYLDMVVADYEGGGFSETEENRAASEKERKDIVEMYLPQKSLLKFDLYRKLSLQPLREKLAKNEKTAPLYHKLRTKLMGFKRKDNKEQRSNEQCNSDKQTNRKKAKKK